MLKKELLQKAKELKIRGRTKMTKDQLLDAIMKIEGVEDDKDDKKGMKQAKIDEMYSTPEPVKGKKVAKKADPSPKSSPRPSKQPKLNPKMQAQLKAKMAEVAAEKK
tara:strand:+ start:336 stop:656 length:321 start_codon:yes stop_codon:yes gene_type:complete